MTANHDILEQLTVDCLLALFEHYKLPLGETRGVTPQDIWEENFAWAGLIGFTSPQLRGSLVLAVCTEALQTIEEEPRFHRDWIQELANQLLGRIKNDLLAYGVDLSMTTPLSMRGAHLTLEPSESQRLPQLFRTEHAGAVCVLLDAEITPGVTLERNQDAANSCPDEGEVIMF